MDLATLIQSANAEPQRPSLREQEVLVPGHEIPVDTVSKRTTVGKIAHYAVDRGWTVKVGESTYRTRDRIENGAVLTGREEKHQWAQGVRGSHHFSVSKLILIIDGWPVPTVDEVKIHLDEHGDGDSDG